MLIPSGGTGSCAFTLDVQWILDAIERVQRTVRKVGSMMEKVMNKAADILEALGGIMSIFCWMPGIGKILKSVVAKACRLIGKVQKAVHEGMARVLEVGKHVLAPWEVRSAGKSIADQLAPKCEEFALQFHKGRLKSAETWTGAASQAFFASYSAQQKAAEDTAKGAKAFGDAVHKLGADGVKTTVKFITELVTAAIGIIAAAVKMAAVPAGTAIGAAEIFGLIGAIISYIAVWVNAMMSMISQMSEMENAAHQAVPGGEWPKAVV